MCKRMRPQFGDLSYTIIIEPDVCEALAIIFPHGTTSGVTKTLGDRQSSSVPIWLVLWNLGQSRKLLRDHTTKRKHSGKPHHRFLRKSVLLPRPTFHFLKNTTHHKIQEINDLTWVISVSCTFSSHFLKETQFCVANRYKYVREECKDCKYK